MAAEMVFKLGANVGEAVQGMSLVQDRVQKLETSIKYFQDKLANTQSQKFYAFAIDQISKKKQELAQITRATGGALDRSSDATRRATSSMTDLSRIVQDAPFGFIGIANNINPLVESFGRLKKETGSTGGAFKALLGSLAGPAGIGLAVSAVTSLLVVFGDKLFGTTKKSQENADALSKLSTEQKILKGEVLSASEAEKKQTDELQKQASSLEKLNELIRRSGLSYAQRSAEAQGSVQQEIALVTSLASVVQNQSLSYEQRNNALNKLKSINQGYFGDLNLEAASLTKLTAKVQEYTSALVAQEVVKGYTKDIADLTIANAGATRSIDDLKKQQSQLNEQLKKTSQFNLVLRGNVGYVKEQNSEWAKLQTQLNSVNSQISTQTTALTKGKDAAQALTKDLNGAVIEASKFKSPDVKPVKPKIQKVTKKEIEDNLINPIEFTKISGPNVILQALIAEPKLTDLEKIDKIISEGLQKLVKPFKIPVTEIDLKTKKEKEALEAKLELAQKVASGISGAFDQAFGSILEGENVFTALGKSLKGFVLELVQATIKALIFRAIINAFDPGFARASGATGIANLLGFRANGGPVTGQAPYIVGERGPELFVPSVSGNIIPNNRLSSFNGRPAFATSGGGRSVVRGNDILLASARTQRSQNRVNA